MCQPNLTQQLRSQVRANGDANATVLTLPWMLGFGASTLRVVDELRAIEGSMSTTVRWRTAPVLKRLPDSGGWTASGSSRTSAGMGTQDFSISAAMANRKLQIQPRLNDGKVMMVPLCDPLPAVGFSNMMYAMNLYGLNGDITVQPAFRTFDADTIKPNSWQTVGTAETTDSATDTENLHNFGTLSPSLGTSPKPMYVQPGVKITSTDDDLRCMIELTVAATW